jgi:hypothetical protein
MDITTSAGLDDAHEVQTLIVYDPETGAIVHRHYVVTFAGAQAASGKDIEARAIGMARTQRRFKGAVAVLRADGDPFEEPAVYRVDVKRGKVVSTPLRIRRNKRGGRSR